MKALRAFGAPTTSLSARDLCEPEIVYQIGVAPVRVDILTSISGLQFEQAYERAERITFSGSNVRVLALDDILAAKLAAGRPQDLLDAERLEAARVRALPQGAASNVRIPRRDHRGPLTIGTLSWRYSNDLLSHAAWERALRAISKRARCDLILCAGKALDGQPQPERVLAASGGGAVVFEQGAPTGPPYPWYAVIGGAPPRCHKVRSAQARCSVSELFRARSKDTIAAVYELMVF